MTDAATSLVPWPLRYNTVIINTNPISYESLEGLFQCTLPSGRVCDVALIRILIEIHKWRHVNRRLGQPGMAVEFYVCEGTGHLWSLARLVRDPRDFIQGCTVIPVYCIRPTLTSDAPSFKHNLLCHPIRQHCPGNIVVPSPRLSSSCPLAPALIMAGKVDSAETHRRRKYIIADTVSSTALAG